MEEKNKKNLKLPAYKRFILIVFVCLFVFSSPLTTPKAHALWPDIPGFTYKQMLEEIRDRIKGMILSMLKQQAIKTITQQVDSMISGGGSSGSAKFITDWQAYLFKTPDSNTKLYMNDYLSKITSGKGSLSSYTSEGFSSSGSGSSYASQLVKMAKKSTTEKKDPTFNYEGDPASMFSSGNFKDFNKYLSGVNNPWSFDANAAQEYTTKKTEERKLAETKSKAYLGGIGVGEGSTGKGKISLPGSVIVQTKANVMDLGNKVLAAATHPEEVVTAIVSQMMTQALKQGMSQLQSQLSGLPFGSEISSMIGDLNPSSFYDSASSLLSGSSSSSTSEAASEIGGMGYAGDSSGSADSEVGGMGYTGDSTDSSGSTATTESSSIPPPERDF